MNVGQLLFGFSGRINRGKYWLAVLIYVIASLVVGLVVAGMGGSGAAQALNGIFSVVVLVSSIAVALKRLHDRDKSGWWLLLFYFAPGILIAIGMVLGVVNIAGNGLSGGGGGAIVLILAAAAIGIWGFIEIACLRGTAGPNQYGPDTARESRLSLRRTS